LLEHAGKIELSPEGSVGVTQRQALWPSCIAQRPPEQNTIALAFRQAQAGGQRTSPQTRSSSGLRVIGHYSISPHNEAGADEFEGPSWSSVSMIALYQQGGVWHHGRVEGGVCAQP